MNIALWVAQGLLAVVFLLLGGIKTYRPLSHLVRMFPWIIDTPIAFVRFNGISELLGGLGLIIPALLHILPWLTVVAAIGLTVVMICAAIFHFSRREYASIGNPTLLLFPVAFVALGRWLLVPLK